MKNKRVLEDSSSGGEEEEVKVNRMQQLNTGLINMKNIMMDEEDDGEEIAELMMRGGDA